MARGINKVILIGNVGKDPELKVFQGGGSVTNITLATSESRKNKETGQREERTEWHNVVFFNRQAEIANEYLRKGSKVYIEGSLRTRKWTDKKSGQDRYTTEIVSNEMQMLDSRNDGGQQQKQLQNDNSVQMKPEATIDAGPNTASTQMESASLGNDIPF